MTQHLPTDWSELNKIRKFPAQQIVNDAVRMGIKEKYSDVEYKKLNRNGDITKTSKGDIFSFVILCSELFDRDLIKKSIKK
jgi:uncharacterized protein YcsI (UPF0317 family)